MMASQAASAAASSLSQMRDSVTNLVKEKSVLVTYVSLKDPCFPKSLIISSVCRSTRC